MVVGKNKLINKDTEKQIHQIQGLKHNYMGPFISGAATPHISVTPKETIS